MNRYVSVIIVTWNSAEFIDKCLGSIYAQTTTNIFEVIVIDNGSSDNTIEHIKGNYPNVSLIQNGENLGFAPAVNIGIRKARGELIFILNPDTFFKTDVIGILAEFIKSHSDTGASGPMSLNEDGSIDIFSSRQLPSLSSIFFIQFGLRKLFPTNSFFGEETIPKWDRNLVRNVPFLSGSAIMIPRTIFEQEGLLDEQLPMYFEDLDICARISSLGKKLYYVPSAKLIHLKGKSADLSAFRALLFSMENGQAPWSYFMKYRGHFCAKIFTAIIFTGSLFRLILLSFLFPVAAFLPERYYLKAKENYVKSWSLFKWSFCRKMKFKDRLKGIFTENPHKPILPSDVLFENKFKPTINVTKQ